MSDAKTGAVSIVTIGGLDKAVPLLATDSFALCQNPAGCTETDALFSATMQQVADYLLPLAAFSGGTIANDTTFQAGLVRSAAPAPSDNTNQVPTTAWVNAAITVGIKAVEVLGSIKALDLSNSSDLTTMYLKYPFGTLYVITDIIFANPSAPVADVPFNISGGGGEVIAIGNLTLANVPVTDTSGGSIQRLTSGEYQTTAYVTDQARVAISAMNPAPPGTVCDLYLLGFSLQ
jgi:hypothetical protein